MNDIYSVLSGLGIPYRKYEHPAVFTVAESEKYDTGIPGGKTKNLFLRNQKGTEYYLVIAEAERTINLRQVAGFLGTKKLSFGSQEKMKELLGVFPGSVSPFGLINDVQHSVTVVIQNHMMHRNELGFHPNINTATLVISTEDFRKFLSSTGNTVLELDF